MSFADFLALDEAFKSAKLSIDRRCVIVDSNWHSYFPQLQKFTPQAITCDFLRLDQHPHPLFSDQPRQSDELHLACSGNKWLKLRGWLIKYYSLHLDKHNTPIVTMGGAYSSHLVAAALICQKLGLKCIACIRDTQQTNKDASPSITRLIQLGVEIIYVSRSNYRLLREFYAPHTQQASIAHQVIETLIQYKNYWFIPEGGLGYLGLEGVADWAYAHAQQLSRYDVIYTGLGSGMTLTGLILGLYKASLAQYSPYSQHLTNIIGVAAFKAYPWMAKAVRHYLSSYGANQSQWWVNYQYGQQGFKPYPPHVVEFLVDQLNVALDPTYLPRVIQACITDALMSRLSFNSSLCLDHNQKLEINSLILHNGGLQTQGSCWPNV